MSDTCVTGHHAAVYLRFIIVPISTLHVRLVILVLVIIPVPLVILIVRVRTLVLAVAIIVVTPLRVPRHD